MGAIYSKLQAVCYFRGCVFPNGLMLFKVCALCHREGNLFVYALCLRAASCLLFGGCDLPWAEYMLFQGMRLLSDILQNLVKLLVQ
jgi:hypothetical protein